MKDFLQDLVKQSQGYLELRYHKRISSAYMVQKNRVDVASHAEASGLGVRALHNGVWGFAATADMSEAGIRLAVQQAQDNALALFGIRGPGTCQLAPADFYVGDYADEGFEELLAMPIGEKMAAVIAHEKALSGAGSEIQSARCRYKEILEEKIIVTSDGAAASMKLAQPEVSFSAIAERDGAQVSAYNAAGVSGGWNCLFAHPSLENVIDKTAQLATDLLSAPYVEGGMKDVILAPAVVGLLCHEAIGHTVEADFVRSGSVAQGKLGQRVGSELVTMCDSGFDPYSQYAVGRLPFDDEGVKTQETVIIEDGLLKSYLHSRETAHEFGVAPTGNARAWLFDDEPLIRMRNTYMRPGEHSLEEMVADIKDGYLIEGAGGGQADANGEFMFGCGHVWHIQDGKRKQLMREATLSGMAFDVMKSVSGVSREFLWDLGSGYCGKGQPAKVDAGGPYVRCQMHIGGR